MMVPTEANAAPIISMVGSSGNGSILEPGSSPPIRNPTSLTMPIAVSPGWSERQIANVHFAAQINP